MTARDVKNDAIVAELGTATGRTLVGLAEGRLTVEDAATAVKRTSMVMHAVGQEDGAVALLAGLRALRDKFGMEAVAQVLKEEPDVVAPLIMGSTLAELLARESTK